MFRLPALVLLATLVAPLAKAQAPAQLTEAVGGGVTFTDSNLPIVVIETPNAQGIPDEPKVTALMGVIDNGPGERNRLGDPYAGYAGYIGIETRGASSQAVYPKKSYALETRRADGENRNVRLLGLPRENDWILYAPYADKSLTRNVLAYEFARRMGGYAVRTRYVEVVLNGEYRGVYVLMERIKQDDDRVPIDELTPDDNGGDALTGGYIVKVDRPAFGDDGWASPYLPEGFANRQVFYQYHDPNPSNLTDAQRTYIRSYITQFEAMMDGDGWTDPASGYPAWLDVDSAVDFLLLNELGKNVDGYRLSSFLYKARDSAGGRLYLGPIWDFNFAFGIADYYGAERPAGYQVAFAEAEDSHQNPFWWRKLARDPAFIARAQARWQALRTGALAEDSLMSFVDEQAALLDEAQARNFRRWPVLGSYVWANSFIGSTYASEVAFLKSWLRQRLQWLDANLPLGQLIPDNPDPIDVPVLVTRIGAPAPNPFTQTATLRFDLDESQPIRVTVHDVLGREVSRPFEGIADSGEDQTVVVDGSVFPPGVYLVRIVGLRFDITHTLVKL
ncbi:MAG: CotH kinase family protein [Bacteroidota bacterium]